MKFKLDENLGPTIKQMFQESGYDVHTIFEQNMLGTKDTYIYEHCLREGYCLVSLDLDFSDIVRFPPVNTHGSDFKNFIFAKHLRALNEALLYNRFAPHCSAG